MNVEKKKKKKQSPQKCSSIYNVLKGLFTKKKKKVNYHLIFLFCITNNRLFRSGNYGLTHSPRI
jgi:hypothetical protein